MNPIIAERLTAEKSRDHMNARRVAKEYEAQTRTLNKQLPSIPPTGDELYLYEYYLSETTKDFKAYLS